MERICNNCGAARTCGNSAAKWNGRTKRRRLVGWRTVITLAVFVLCAVYLKRNPHVWARILEGLESIENMWLRNQGWEGLASDLKQLAVRLIEGAGSLIDRAVAWWSAL